MSAALLVAAVFLPLALAAALVVPAWRGAVARLAPLAPLPGLAAATLDVGSEVALPLLMGVTLGLDAPAPVFLAFTAVIWIAAAAQARLEPGLFGGPGGGRFLACFLVAMSGNLGLIVALDRLGFFMFFTVMSFAAYGLIVRDDEAAARRAGRIYLAVALFAEVLMLAGFMALAAGVGAGLAVAVLLYFGLGAKHAVLPLHLWLPQAHGIAPVPASALLSGAMLKAGFVGWLRFLPEAGDGAAALAAPMIASGLAAAFLGAAGGVLQARPKMALAYSSISQMGIVTAAAGVAVSEPWSFAVLLPALALFALHHALAKAALFLGMGARRDGPGGGLVWPALVVLAAAIAAAPLTGGALAKLWLDQFGGRLPARWDGILALLMPLTSIASALVMARVLWLVRAGPAVAAPVAPWPFLALAAAALAGPWVLVFAWHEAPLALAFQPAHLWKVAWPPALGLLAAILAWRAAGRGARLPFHLPPGDLAVPLLHLAERLRQWHPRWPLPAPTPRLPAPAGEPGWRRFSSMGAAFMLLLVAFAAAGLIGH